MSNEREEQLDSKKRREVSFDKGYQSLLLLQGNMETIDQFVKGYTMLLATVREGLTRARTVEESRRCAEQGRRLRSLLRKQIGFVLELKQQAIVEDADLAAMPAIET